MLIVVLSFILILSLYLNGLKQDVLVKILGICVLILSHSPTYAQHEAVAGQFLIKFHPKKLSQRTQTSIRSQLGVQMIKEHKMTGAQLVQIKSNKSFDHNYAKQLLAEGWIDYIEPNYLIKLKSTPNDSYYQNLWGMNNTGQMGGSSDVDIDAVEAWSITHENSNTVVGVVDTGILYSHPDLQNNMWVNTAEIPNNGIDEDGNGVVDDIYGYNAITGNGNPLDDHGHGTHCAGTIGAVGNNSNGVVGVNWTVKLMALKFLDSSGSGTMDAAISAIEYAVTMKQSGVNIKVLSNSWGGSEYSQTLNDAISAANSAGILFVAAAGNDSKDTDQVPNYPSNYDQPNVVSVAAIDQNGNLANFSNYGTTTVDIAAPGVDIFSTYINNSYQYLSGTSMATPHVSGVAALVAGYDSSLNPSALRRRLMLTAKPLSTLNGIMQSPGIVNALNALTDARTNLPELPEEVEYSKTSIPAAYDSNLGTRVLNSDDGYISLALPFNFTFFGQSFNSIAISANGRVIPLSSEQSIPTALDYSNSPVAGISVYHDDLYPSPFSSDSGVWANTNSSFATITWVVALYPHRLSTDSQKELRFQLKIYSSGKLEYHYLDTYTNDNNYDFGASATVGVAPVSGTVGKVYTISHNTSNQNEIGNGHALTLFVIKSDAPSDYDGDGISDIIVFRPSNGWWFILPSESNFEYSQLKAYQLGLPGDQPLIGDFDGDGHSDLAVWRPSNGFWFTRQSSQNYSTINWMQWGLPGDKPISADFDGDGLHDMAVYRPSIATTFILRSSGGFNRSSALAGNQTYLSLINLGGLGYDALTGDFNGDGAADLSLVWQPARYWQVKNFSNQLIMNLPWGMPGDTPLTCDFDGDSLSDRIIVRANASGTLDWFIAYANTRVDVLNHGYSGDIPLCNGDYDGDNKPDLTTFHPATGEWIVKNSSTAQIITRQFGLPGDIPL